MVEVIKEVFTPRKVKMLKRSLLGFLGMSAIKTLDDISSALVKVGIAKSFEEAKFITPTLAGQYLDYGIDMSLNIEERRCGYIDFSNNLVGAEYEVTALSLVA